MKMKHYLSMAVVAMALAACSDDYDDTALWNTVNDHENRIAALEQWQDEVNNNIAALQQLLNTNDMITSVTPVMENGKEVGYTIAFLHSDPITIYHGEKGEKGDKGEQGIQGEQGVQGTPGKDGADGDTPVVGLLKGDDGNWYWTLDGELMTDPQGNPIRANGEDGKDGQPGQDGKPGADGEEGEPGAPAPTPQIGLGSSIESGTIVTDNGVVQLDAWYLSVDGGATWYRISGDKGATGDKGDTGAQGPQGDQGEQGPQGIQGEQGDSWFACAPTLSEDGAYYIFTLADGDDDPDNNPTIEVAAYQSLRIGTGTGTLAITGATAEISLTYPDGTTADDYSALVTQITPEGADGTYTDISTRATDANGWSVEGDLANAKVTVVAGSGKALLRVTLIRNNGDEVTASRIVEKPNYTVSEDGKTYTVYNAEGLIEWANAVNALVNQYLDLNCVLADDIEMQGKDFPVICKGNGGYDWYTGTFNGNGHTISNLTINSEEDYIGFIRKGQDCTVQDVTFKNLSVTTSGANVGGILGTANGSTIVKNCHVIGGTIKSDKENGAGGMGGIIGFITSGDVEVYACSSSAKIEGTSYQGQGGIVGDNGGTYKYEGGKITACYATGSFSNSSSQYVGAIAGGINYGEITACYWDMEDVTYGYYKTTDSGKEGVSEGKIFGDNWDAVITTMNNALASAGISDYEWIKNTGDDAGVRPIVVQTAD